MGRGRGLLDFDMGDPFKQGPASGEESFFASPAAQGLLGALFGGAAAARRGAPWNTFGAAGLSGLHGFNTAAAQEPSRAWMKGVKQYMTPQTVQVPQKVQMDSAGESPYKNDGTSLTPIIDSVNQSQWNASIPSVDITRNVQTSAKPSITSIPNDYLMRGMLAGVPQASALYKFKQDAMKGIEQDPTKTYIDPDTGKPRSYGMKLPEGMYVGPDGVPRFAPGYTGQMVDYTSKIENAKARANANYDLLDPSKSPWKVGSDGRPRPMVATRGQVVQGLRGDWNNVNNDYAQGQPTRNAEQLRILQTELDNERNPENRAALQREIARVRGNTQSQTPYYPTPAEQAGQKMAAEKRVDADFGLPKVITKAESALQNVDAILSHPGKSTALGIRGYVDPRNYVPGTDAMDFKQRLKQLEGQVFLQAFESLKGGGQITEVEGNKAQNALVRASRAQSEAAFNEAMQEYKDVIKKGVDVAKRQAGASGSQQQGTDIDALLKKYGG